MNKTKKYVIQFVVLGFMLIGIITLYNMNAQSTKTLTTSKEITESIPQDQEKIVEKENQSEDQSSHEQKPTQPSTTNKSSVENTHKSQQNPPSDNKQQNESQTGINVSVVGVDGTIAAGVIEYNNQNAFDVLKTLCTNKMCIRDRYKPVLTIMNIFIKSEYLPSIKDTKPYRRIVEKAKKKYAVVFLIVVAIVFSLVFFINKDNTPKTNKPEQTIEYKEVAHETPLMSNIYNQLKTAVSRNKKEDIRQLVAAYFITDYFTPVSYTHLDVYKRQVLRRSWL